MSRPAYENINTKSLARELGQTAHTSQELNPGSRGDGPILRRIIDLGVVEDKDKLSRVADACDELASKQGLDSPLAKAFRTAARIARASRHWPKH